MDDLQVTQGNPVIWKYSLETTDYQAIDMPKGAKILSVAAQRGQVCLWALVDSTAPTVPRAIICNGTGHPAERVEDAAFVGSYQLLGGDFVGHVFDAGEMAAAPSAAR